MVGSHTYSHASSFAVSVRVKSVDGGATTFSVGLVLDWHAPRTNLDFYLAYLLWASRMMRIAYPNFMEDFADWFIQTAADEGVDAEDFRDELRQLFATAFEFIVIGAAHLEDAVLCPCG